MFTWYSFYWIGSTHRANPISFLKTKHKKHLRICVAAKISRESKLQVAYTQNDQCFWLLNRSDTNVVLPSGELFGFNVGTYVEVASDGIEGKE